ncbi:MAG: DUF3341 domain-containing protein [Phycisphaerae bacterium]|nr:DUF3341 domain-containing protein [Phycisphaerae bacterium]
MPDDNLVTPNAPTPEPPQTGELYGLIVEFDGVDGVVLAAEKVRDAGFKRWDVHTPFPVHGLDEAMGIRPTILPYVVLLAAIGGAGAAMLLQWWTNAFDYPIIISGKPFFSVPANIPVTFELTILFAAATAFVGLLAFNGLPQLYHPLFNNRRFRQVTTDRFFIAVEATDPKFDLEQTRAFLETLGGACVQEVREPS